MNASSKPDNVNSVRTVEGRHVVEWRQRREAEAGAVGGEGLDAGQGRQVAVGGGRHGRRVRMVVRRRVLLLVLVVGLRRQEI